MQKNSWSLERALKKVRARRECVAPHDGFLAQLKLYESMGYGIDGSNVQFKMFRKVPRRRWTLFRVPFISCGDIYSEVQIDLHEVG